MDELVVDKGITISHSEDGTPFLSIRVPLGEDGTRTPSRPVMEVTEALLLENTVICLDGELFSGESNPYGVPAYVSDDGMLLSIRAVAPPLENPDVVLEPDQDVTEVLSPRWRILELLHTDRSGEFLVQTKYTAAARRVWDEEGVFAVLRVPRKRGKKTTLEFYLIELVVGDTLR